MGIPAGRFGIDSDAFRDLLPLVCSRIDLALAGLLREAGDQDREGDQG